MTALDRTTDASYRLPAELKPDAVDDVKRGWRAGEIAFPPEKDAANETPHPSSEPQAASRIQQGVERRIGKPRILAAIVAPEPVAVEPAPALISPKPVALPWANARWQSPQIVPVRQQAVERIRRGFRLADRNAPYQARAEFIAVLELVAEANDARRSTRFYTRALTAGVTALAESSDFLRRPPLGKQLDVARIVSGHKTPILKNAALDRLAPTVAAQRYYAYAREQLAAAAAGEADASMALFGLAEAAIAVGVGSPSRHLESTAQAIVLYQAAVMADPMNYRAANKLGVILAQKDEESVSTAKRSVADWLPWNPHR